MSGWNWMIRMRSESGTSEDHIQAFVEMVVKGKYIIIYYTIHIYKNTYFLRTPTRERYMFAQNISTIWII